MIMRILWLSNFMLPMAAAHLGLPATNKEGWLSGLASAVLALRAKGGTPDSRIELAAAFPVAKERDGYAETIEGLSCYGFYEDMQHPELYDRGLEERLKRILDDFQPDLVHCFGTEYPHTLAMCRTFHDKNRILIGIQGLCAVYADAYMADMPETVVNSATFRDRVKRDSLKEQQEKYRKRGALEQEAISLSGNITGRTAWDKYYAEKWNPAGRYFHMNETLRETFYRDQWSAEMAEPYTIFLSQGNYPIKGLHYMLLALPKIREKYPKVRVSVAGDSVTAYKTLKDRLKLSSYGRYLRQLMTENHLEDCVEFLGSLDAEAMKAQYLRSSLFVCCSSIENSPNSLGEAMLLGMPCVSADVGGVSSIFCGGEDGILYPGYKTAENTFDMVKNEGKTEKERLLSNAEALADAVLRMWDDPDRQSFYCENARIHAKLTHDREKNFRRMTEIYAEIIRGSGS